MAVWWVQGNCIVNTISAQICVPKCVIFFLNSRYSCYLSRADDFDETASQTRPFHYLFRLITPVRLASQHPPTWRGVARWRLAWHLIIAVAVTTTIPSLFEMCHRRDAIHLQPHAERIIIYLHAIVNIQHYTEEPYRND